MIKLDELIPTHNNLRNPKLIFELLEALDQGAKIEPIILKALDDGSTYIHDGLHRSCAYWLYGVRELPSDYYVLKHQYTYEMFSQPNIHVGWFTPYDLKTECRIPNFKDWKDTISNLMKTTSETGVNKFILSNSHKYKEPRRVYRVSDVLAYRKENEEDKCVLI